MSDAHGRDGATPRGLPREVWVLGLVSLLTDASSEFVHALLPVFLAGTMGASALAIGAIEGAAEALALATKVVSGYISDFMGRRKPLIVLGYGLATLSKPLIPLAGTVTWILGARLLDRFGKGIRGAPRDALVADVTEPAQRGRAYGLRQALDTAGAIAGPLLAIAAVAYFAGDLRLALWVAVVPGVIAVALLVFGIRETQAAKPKAKPRLPITRAGVKALGSAFWRITLVGAVLTFARSTEAFLVLRAADVGLATLWVPLVMVAMSVVYVAAAYPAGWWADHRSRMPLLIGGMVALLAADALLMSADGLVLLFAGVALWGLHMGLTQGVLAAMIADVAPRELRASAFGVFNLVGGAVLFAASVLSGALWDAYGPAFTFGLGAAAALVGLAALWLLPPRATAAA